MTNELDDDFPALATLDQAIETLQQEIQLAQAAHLLSADRLAQTFATVQTAVNEVRATIAQWAEQVGEPMPTWTDRADLDHVATLLRRRFHEQQANQWRQRLETLAVQLEQAEVINHRNQRPVPVLNALRRQVVNELRTAATGNEAHALPNSEATDWLAWAWALPPDEATRELDPIAAHFPQLSEFLASVNPDDWRPTPPVAPRPVRVEYPPPPPSPAPAVEQPPIAPIVEPAPLVPPVAVTPPIASTPKVVEKKNERIDAGTMRKVTFARFTSTPTHTSNKATYEQKKPASNAPMPVQLPPLPPEPEVVPPVPEPPMVEEPDVPLALLAEEENTIVEIAEFDESIVELETLGSPLNEPLPTFEPIDFVPEIPATTPTASLATEHEIVTCCQEGEFLRAALLSYGREVLGHTDLDPDAQVLLIAHHVLHRSDVVPWPDWCHDSTQANTIVRERLQSAQFVYLSAQYQAALSGLDPLASDVSNLLLDSFNDASAIRQLLALLEEVKCVPGLLEQIRTREAVVDPKAEYARDRKTFMERANRANQLRPQAAYHHRQDHYLNRLPAGRLLLQWLTEKSPSPQARGAHPEIDQFLTQKPSDVVEDWWVETGRVIQLQGDDRIHLRKHAASYLQLANKAWQSARALLSSGTKRDDVDDYRKKLLELAPKAREQATTKRWASLLERLLGGLER